MAYKWLSSSAMVGASSPLVSEDSEAAKIIKATKDLQSAAKHVAKAHDQLVKTQPGEEVPNPEHIELTQQVLRLDEEFDATARAQDALFTGLALLERDAKARESIRQLHQLVLPDGMVVVNRAYLEEAGAVKLLKGRLKATHKKQLKALTLPQDRTMADVVDRWIALGIELGEVESKRQATPAMLEKPAVTRAEAAAARNRWIRAMTHFVSAVELLELDEATVQILLGALRAAEATADKRQARKTAGRQKSKKKAAKAKAKAADEAPADEAPAAEPTAAPAEQDG